MINQKYALLDWFLVRFGPFTVKFELPIGSRSLFLFLSLSLSLSFTLTSLYQDMAKRRKRGRVRDDLCFNLLPVAISKSWPMLVKSDCDAICRSNTVFRHVIQIERQNRSTDTLRHISAPSLSALRLRPPSSSHFRTLPFSK
jgi:hypothetical protein